ncbi:LysM peptidoglycan-binding domain-containing protein [Kitasatospora sp. LaBMicrA B282]|uniref:LysM peptidoglycan-binding domain-containing protein n=1 Tax=Kitasatospora sp. LaBMicrA B282 TaxID=3420949 RepID=UPI003D09BDC1
MLQPDGNLVLVADGSPLWASGTDGSGVVEARMQQDGNFVVYDSSGSAKWSTGTEGNDGAYLELDGDGNLTVRTGDGGVLWESGTRVVTVTASGTGAVAAPAGVPQGQAYTVQDGDSLWAIAERFYGDGDRYQEIANANGIANPT